MDDDPDFVFFFDSFLLETQSAVISFCVCLCKTESNARSEMSFVVVDHTRGAEKTRGFCSVGAMSGRTIDSTWLNLNL